MFSVCEMPPSPWHAVHSSAFSLPAATSAAWAERLASVEIPNARPYSARNTNRRRMIGIPVSSRTVIPGCAAWRRPGMTVIRKQKLRPLVPEQPQPLISQLLLLVADAIDRTGPVVSDEDRTVLVQNDIGWTAEITLITFEPAGCEHILLGILAIGTDGDTHDPRALIFMPVPRAVFGNQDAVLVLGGKLAAGVELHAERSHVGAELQHRRGELRTFVTHRELWIRQVALMAVRIAEVLAELRDHVELVARYIVAHPVTGVFGEPVLAAARIDIAADAVANAEGTEVV